MTRSSRLMAAMLAALFAAVLASPAYATGSGTCAPHTRTTGTGCKAEGTKFHDLDADGERDSGEPGLAGFRIWADYDDDGVRDSGEPFDDTDSAGRYLITGINPPAGARTTTSAKRYRLREQLSSGSGTGDWACSYPNASTSGGFSGGAGGGFGCGWGPIDAAKTSHATNQDFGNYRKARITVIKDLVPATDSGRFDLKVDGVTVKPAAGDGGTGSVLVKPGAHQVTETAASGTSLADYAASTDCKTTIGPRTYGAGGDGVVHPGSGDQVVCTIRNVRHGKVEIVKQTDPHETGGSAFGFTGFAGAFSLADGGLETITHVVPRSEPYTVTEAAVAGYRLSALTCNDGDSTGALSTRTASIRVAAGETVRCTFVNTKLASAIEVVKAGPDRVHHGDRMEFTFAVRNVGNSPLHAVTVTDDRCAPVSATPVTKTGDDGDELLESGEVWIHSCSKTAPSHVAGETDPLCNIATATGQDEQDKPVTDTDKHCTDILHPAIALAKTANRETAQVGDTVTYRFDVTNPGDTGLTVTLSDPRCDAGTLTGPQKLAGDQDDLLEPDEQWRYTCTHKVTAQDPDPLPNTAHATGKDPIGGPSGTVEAEDSASVDIVQPTKAADPPQQQVLAATEQRQARASARLRGPSGCVYRPFAAVVSGRQIRRVTFFVDGRRVARRTARGGQRRFTARIRPGALRPGVHRVTARVVFRRGARPRTLVLSFQRCVRQDPSPRFTG
jgi:hypothetical protein